MIGVKISVDKVALVTDRKIVRKVMRAAGQEVAARAKAMIKQGSKATKKAAQRQSAPGTAPVSRTGNLARQFKVTLSKGGMVVRVEAAAGDAKGRPYGRFLETGASGGGGRPRKGVTAMGIKRRQGGRAWVKKASKAAVNGKRRLEPRPFLSAAQQAALNAQLSQRIADALWSDLKLVKLK